MEISKAMSIVVPSLNQGRFIEETLGSILCQSEADIEVIVVDGGSDDGTVEILRGFGDAVRWVSQPDLGIYDALNTGFSMAQGEIVGWLNSDDVYFRTDALSIVRADFQKHPEADLIYGDVAIISEESHLLRLRLLPEFDQARLERSNIIAQPAVFMRRAVVQEENLRPFLSLDYEYWIRLGRKGYRFKHSPTILAGDRQYPNRVSMRFRDEMTLEFQAYKEEFGIPRPIQPPRRALDRLQLAPLRLKGFYILVRMILMRDYSSSMAFPMKVESLIKLLWNQLTQSVLKTGLYSNPSGAFPEQSDRGNG